ncbi:DUF4429 domain-containing protein [Planomonospora sp. ID82291]|uniref:DUF4429 domain-containing protein n=1 Tax=Planomonospora sp. ID82291 TaxID=2738136 RepID=UPI0018C3EF77|nr:DUF4429 domain-containing protein [Planomonospora sp. ID82291]MBG0814056.1 DUF4429 domain-containing protein [Planomonospora sp. ID82291]
MAEVMGRDGTWTFDGEILRIVPGRDRGVHKLRQSLGEVTVPLEAVAGVSYEPGKKGGRLRLRLREGADPFIQAARGRIPDSADPYQLAVEPDRTGVAEYFVDEVRNALVIEQVPDAPVSRYLMPGPSVPLTAAAGDGTATFDGDSVRLEWNWTVESTKKSAGPQRIPLSELTGVEWIPAAGLENGHIRFHVHGSTHRLAPKYDPHCLVLWGMDKETRTIALLLAALTARLPHPSAPAPPAAERAALTAQATATGTGEGPAERAGKGSEQPDDHDTLLRRLRELGGLHRDGVLTDEEFAQAKQAILRRF